VYTVTDAQRSRSEDIAYRQRRYLISMGVRVVAFLLAVFLFHGVWRFVAAAVALVVPYFAVVFANGGREPNNSASFDSFEPNVPGGDAGAGSGQETEAGTGAVNRGVSGGIAGGGNNRGSGGGGSGSGGGSGERDGIGTNSEGLLSDRKLQAPSRDRSEC
jgi:uncharacterized membrane protein YgcG